MATEMLYGTVSARVLRVIDGDTIEVRAQVWPDIEVTASVRLAGIDAPELRAPCTRERDLAIAARELLAHTLAREATVLLTDIAHDKYAGRVIADMRLPDGRDAAQLLLAAGLAVGYGQERNWCAP